MKGVVVLALSIVCLLLNVLFVSKPRYLVLEFSDPISPFLVDVERVNGLGSMTAHAYYPTMYT